MWTHLPHAGNANASSPDKPQTNFPRYRKGFCYSHDTWNVNPRKLGEALHWKKCIKTRMKAFVLARLQENRIKYAYIEKENRSEISNLSFHFMKLEKEKQVKLKVSKGKEIIKIETKSMKLK